MKLEIFAHIFPPAYFEKLSEIVTDKAKLKRRFEALDISDSERAKL